VSELHDVADRPADRNPELEGARRTEDGAQPKLPSDQSSSETSLAGIAAATGDTAFAENLREVAKSLETLKAELGAPAVGKPRARAKKADGASRPAGTATGDGSDRDSDGWPLDLNTDVFLKGADAEDTGPPWGCDPDGVASPKAR
jgi:hypothetical protein